MKKHIVIIGGGVAGTSAAHKLVKHGYAVTIVEKNSYLGGRVHSQTADGVVVEMGAGFMTQLYTNALTFLRESGLEGQLYRQKSVYGVLRDGAVRMATLRELLGNSTVSWKVKMQFISLVLEALVHWRHLDHHAFWKGAAHDTKSVTDAFGDSRKELLEQLIQPMLNGYFYWSPEHVSHEMLLGLIKAMIIQGKTCNLREGLQLIPETAAKGSKVLLGSSVVSVERVKRGSFNVVIDSDDKTQTIHADGIVCATTASVVPDIFTKILNEQQKAFFNAISYSSTVVVGQTYKNGTIRGDKGIAFPRKENTILSAVTSKLAPSKDGGMSSLKIYASGVVGAELCRKQDGDIQLALDEAMNPVKKELFIGNPSVINTHVQRWYEAIPYFDVDHLRHLRDFHDGKIEDASLPIVFAGDYIGGPFIEGAFTSGVEAALRLNGRLNR